MQSTSVRPAQTPVAVQAWLAYWRALSAWHRYRVDGLEHLLGDQPCLIVGYHGRPVAYDLCMLTAQIHDRLGYLPHGITLKVLDHGPGAKLLRELGFVSGDGPDLDAALQRNEHILVAPGGIREACRSFRDRYRVDWGERYGYLRLAHRLGLPIVPVAASGVDDAILGLNNGYQLGKQLGLPMGLPAWLGLGAVGVWPLAVPFPVAIRQRIGKPLALWQDTGNAEPTERQLADAHRQVQAAVQSLLDDLRRERQQP